MYLMTLLETHFSTLLPQATGQYCDFKAALQCTT